MINNDTVCGTNGSLYATVEEYCTDKIINAVPDLEYYTCGENTHCDSENYFACALLGGWWYSGSNLHNWILVIDRWSGPLFERWVLV